MNLSIRPLRARAVLLRSLLSAVQWRLLLLWILASLGCALLATLPMWSWLGGVLSHSLQSQAMADGSAPMRLLDALLAPDAPLGLLASQQQIATLLMLLLSPWLAGATVTAARARSALSFGELLRGGLSEYGPMLRLLLWSALPLGLAFAVMFGMIGFNEKAHEHAVLASDVESGRNMALLVGGLLLLLAHAGIETGRGWLASDARLRSALKAWWRGTKLLFKRPLAVLSAYLLPTLLSFALALGLLMLRQHLTSSTSVGFLLGLLLASAIAAALAWGRVARLFALRALTEDAHGRR